MSKSPIKAVLFDLDGVLVDAREWHYEALNEALSVFGYSITKQEHDSFYNGLPTRQKLKKLSEDKGFPESLHNLIYDIKQLQTQRRLYSLTRPSFDKQLMLRALKNSGLMIAVCSNSIRETVEVMLKNAMLDSYFDLMLSNQDVKKNKPDPEIYITAMDRLGVLPQETIIVEDAPHGVQAAKASGAQVIVVDNANDVNLYLFRNHLPNLF
jgi:beta-phosphoglucomutase